MARMPVIAAGAHEALALGFHPGKHLRIGLRRHDAQVEDAVAVDVAADREAHDTLVVGDHHDARLVVEAHELLQNAGHGEQRQRLPDVGFARGPAVRGRRSPAYGSSARRAVPAAPRRHATRLRRPRRRTPAYGVRARGRWSSRAGGPASRRAARSPAGCRISRTEGSGFRPARSRIRRSPRRSCGTAAPAPRHRRRPRRSARRSRRRPEPPATGRDTRSAPRAGAPARRSSGPAGPLR